MLKPMEVRLTPDQRAFIREAIAAGRFQREEDAVREALALWEERERARIGILAAIDAAEASLASGGGRAITESGMQELAQSVMKRGRSQLEEHRRPLRY